MIGLSSAGRAEQEQRDAFLYAREGVRRMLGGRDPREREVLLQPAVEEALRPHPAGAEDLRVDHIRKEEARDALIATLENS